MVQWDHLSLPKDQKYCHQRYHHHQLKSQLEKKNTTPKIISKKKTLATKQQQQQLVYKMIPKPRKTMASKGHTLCN